MLLRFELVQVARWVCGCVASIALLSFAARFILTGKTESSCEEMRLSFQLFTCRRRTLKSFATSN